MDAFLPVSAETTACVRGGRACTLQSKHVIFATAHWHSLQQHDNAAEMQKIYSGCIVAFIQQLYVASTWFAYIQLVSQNSVESTNCKYRLCGCTWCCHEKTHPKCFCVITSMQNQQQIQWSAKTDFVYNQAAIAQTVDSAVGVYHCHDFQPEKVCATR